MPYHDGPLPERAKIFLVAGGSDAANFAQEVVDQRRIWREAGFEEDEIVCYWAKPTRRAFSADGPQYLALADELRGCYAARPELLRRHLETVARRRPPTDAPGSGTATEQIPFVYLYVTSHGTQSILGDAEDTDRPQVRQAAASASRCEQELLDRHAMVLAADPAGALHLPSVLEALRAGADPDDLILTPASLRASLAHLPPDMPKLVVLQGCYSGGFIDEDGDPGTVDGLSDLPNLTLLTAARYDRSSFGCQTGADRTEFGRAYHRVLERTTGLSDPPRVRWKTVFRQTRILVEGREKEIYESRSHPGFFRSERRVQTNPSIEWRSCEAPSPR